MTIQVVHNKENPYVIINKLVSEDKNLSWTAKGILFYIDSRPDNWKFDLKELLKQSTDGKQSVISGLRELQKAGHITSQKIGEYHA